ncbi:MAG: hypothetical protein IJR49_06150, partial [Treponema sp.]|nr:hypothetical protein [Treponema sp.]
EVAGLRSAYAPQSLSLGCYSSTGSLSAKCLLGEVEEQFLILFRALQMSKNLFILQVWVCYS